MLSCLPTLYIVSVFLITGMLLGPSAYVILDHFGEGGYVAWALGYPLVIGVAAAALGYQIFKRGDLP